MGSIVKFVCVVALVHIMPAGAVMSTISKFGGHLRPAKLSEGQPLSWSQRLARYLGQEDEDTSSSVAHKKYVGKETEDQAKAKTQIALRVARRELAAAQATLTAAGAANRHLWQAAQHDDANTFFQVEMEEHHIVIEQAEFTISDLLDLGGKRFATLLGLARWQGTPAVKLILILSTAFAVYTFIEVLLVVIRFIARRRATKKLSESELLFPLPVPQMEMYSVNLEERKVLEKMLREDLGERLV